MPALDGGLMGGEPSVAIIIPVYNGVAYLAAALRSVLAQEGCRVSSVIVVDDGSTDSSADIAAAYSAPVRLVRQAHCAASTPMTCCRRAALRCGRRRWAQIPRSTR